MAQAKLKVCCRVSVPGGASPSPAQPFFPALLAVAPDCPVSLCFLLAVEWMLKVELIMLLLLAHGIPRMLVRPASWLAGS